MSEFFVDDGLDGVFNLTPQKVLDSLTTDKIIQILQSLGVTDIMEQEDKLILPTICHNAADAEKSLKLYYYEESKLFTCFTECASSFNIYELIKKVYSLNEEAIGFYEAYNYVLGFIDRAEFTSFEPYRSVSTRYSRKLSTTVLPEYNPAVLKRFPFHPTVEWLNEGITAAAMRKFNIKFSPNALKIIMPHYDLDNRLVGIRGRALDRYEIESYGKYMPVKVEGRWYTHHLSLNLYGANTNKKAIQQAKRAIIFEGEKSILKMSDFYGDDSLAVAVCGNNLHKVQIDILVKLLGVSEIVIAFDKEYLNLRTPEAERYKYRLIALCEKYSNYANFSFIYDMNGLLNIKDAPVDQGKEIYERLYDERVRIQQQ